MMSEQAKSTIKGNLFEKCVGYAVIITLFIISAAKPFKMSFEGGINLFFAMPFCMMISNIIHEMGHALFCIIFRYKIKRINIGIIKIDFYKKKLSIRDSGFLSGNCAFVDGGNRKNYEYILVFMGGVILNLAVVVVLIGLTVLKVKTVVIFALLICCLLNIIANGIYSQSTDRKHIKTYCRKRGW